jgi:hypothetical protein
MDRVNPAESHTEFGWLASHNRYISTKELKVNYEGNSDESCKHAFSLSRWTWKWMVVDAQDSKVEEDKDHDITIAY